MADEAQKGGLTGRSLGKYDILERLSQSSGGDVYLAEDTRLGRRVALKVIPPQMARDPERLRRFEREVRVLASLDHTNLVTLHTVEEIEGLRCFTMELVEGRTLAEVLPAGGLDLDRFLGFALQLAAGISAAHRAGITHRALHPEAILVTEDDRLKVTDFGLAKPQADDPAAAEIGSEDETDDGGETPRAVKETLLDLINEILPYLSPEQVQGHPATPKSDLFSLGVVFHEMLTGERPFVSTRPANLVAAILNGEPTPLADRRPDLPGEVVGLVRRCLEKDPSRRFADVDELRVVLAKIQKRREGRSASARLKRFAPAAILVVLLLVAGMLQSRRGGEDVGSGESDGARARIDARSSLAIPEFETIPPEAATAFLQGRGYAARPDPSGESLRLAVEHLRRAVEHDAYFPPAWAELAAAEAAWAAFAGEDFERARDALERTRALAPESHETALAEIRVSFASGVSEGVENLDRLAAAVPEDLRVVSASAHRDRLRGRFSEARRRWREALVYAGRNASVWHFLAQVESELGDYAQADQAWDRAILLAPEISAWYPAKAENLRLAGAPDAAGAVLDAMPGSGSASEILARFRQAFDVRDDARAQAALEAGPIWLRTTHVRAPRSLYQGMSAAWSGQEDRAQIFLQQAREKIAAEIAVSSEDARLYVAKGLVEAYLGNPEEALAAGRRALSMSDPTLHALRRIDLAEILTHAGAREEAADELRELLTLPAPLSRALLRAEPRWDPLREEPSFAELVRE